MVLVIAGSETTASTMAAIVYHVLADPKLLVRLKAELESVMPTTDMVEPTALSGLPFLNALIQEAIRMYPSASHRQDRVAPDEDIVYERSDGKTFVIPAGTGFGMTARLINRHLDIYDKPDEFRPDRYIEQPSLFSHQFSFFKGARQCIGLNLAYQELQIFVAGIFRKYDIYDPSREKQNGPTLELYHTEERDIAMYGDCIMATQYPGSEGLRVIIRE